MRKLLLTLILVVLVALPALADRSMAGGTCDILSPAFLVPGDVNIIEFLITNNSPDAEWTVDVIFTFPECFEITGGWYDGSVSNPTASFDFVIDNNMHTASFLDNDGGYGEIYGAGVQDLHYGAKQEKGYRVFDISINGTYLSWENLQSVCAEVGLPTVPVLDYGIFTFEQFVKTFQIRFLGNQSGKPFA